MAKPRKPNDTVVDPTNPSVIQANKDLKKIPNKIEATIPNPANSAINKILRENTNALKGHGFDFPPEGTRLSEIKAFYSTSCGKFFLGRDYLTNQLNNSDTIGLWIWLIKVVSETQLIISRAGGTISKENIPDLNRPYQIHRSFNDGFSESYVESSDFGWKNAKKDEGRFNLTKGFFVGKGLIQDCLRFGFEGIQVEVLQDTAGFPLLCFYHVQFDNHLHELGVAYAIRNPYPVGRVLADGAGCSRPCPPYGEE